MKGGEAQSQKERKMKSSENHVLADTCKLQILRIWLQLVFIISIRMLSVFVYVCIGKSKKSHVSQKKRRWEKTNIVNFIGKTHIRHWIPPIHGKCPWIHLSRTKMCENLYIELIFLEKPNRRARVNTLFTGNGSRKLENTSFFPSRTTMESRGHFLKWSLIGTVIGTGLSHISMKEFWSFSSKILPTTNGHNESVRLSVCCSWSTLISDGYTIVLLMMMMPLCHLELRFPLVWLKLEKIYQCEYFRNNTSNQR